MNRFVLDCSVAMAWFFESERDPYADAVLRGLPGRTALVPALYPWRLRTSSWSPNGNAE